MRMEGESIINYDGNRIFACAYARLCGGRTEDSRGAICRAVAVDGTGIITTIACLISFCSRLRTSSVGCFTKLSRALVSEKSTAFVRRILLIDCIHFHW